MKKFIIVIFFVLLAAAELSAQSIYFCKSYTPKGEPIEAQNSWELTPRGVTVFILFHNDKIIDGPLIYMFIDKYENGSYYPYDSKAIKTSGTKTWLAYNYKFTEEGSYAVYFQNAEQKQLADEIIKIKPAEKAFAENESVIAPYYRNAVIKFCDVVIAGKPMNIRSSVVLSGPERKVYIYLNNYKPLNTYEIKVYFWKKNSETFAYDILHRIKRYQVKPDWEDTYFKFLFTEQGDYKIMIYSQSEALIAQGFFKVF